MFVYFSQLQVKRNDFRGPDVFVALDVERKERKSWVAWEEGGRLPDVVIELTSDSTRHVDHVDKKRTYAIVRRRVVERCSNPVSVSSGSSAQNAPPNAVPTNPIPPPLGHAYSSSLPAHWPSDSFSSSPYPP
jgi:hypothetical protein